MLRTAVLLGCLAVLSACASGSRNAPPVASTSPSTSQAFRAPQVMRGAGLSSVIGEQAASLSRRFGEARIDLSEGDARKLQYVSDSCVLDVFLYPLEANGTQVATHVEARERLGGAETDRASCIADVELAANAQ